MTNIFPKKDKQKSKEIKNIEKYHLTKNQYLQLVKTNQTIRKYNNVLLYLLSTYRVITDTERDGSDTEKD